MHWSERFLLLALLTLAVLLGAANPRQVRSESAQQNSAPTNSSKRAATDERGTEKSPLAVKLLNTGKNEQETIQEAAQIQNENDAEWWVRVLTGAGRRWPFAIVRLHNPS
jgi:hypothetical protein